MFHPFHHSQDAGMGWSLDYLVDLPQTQGFQGPALGLGPPMGASHQFDFQHFVFFLSHDLILDPRRGSTFPDPHRGWLLLRRDP